MPLKYLALFLFLIVTACKNPKQKPISKEAALARYLHEVDSLRKESKEKEAIPSSRPKITPYDYSFYKEIAKEKPNFTKLKKLLRKGANINAIYEHSYKTSGKTITFNNPFLKKFITFEEEEYTVHLKETPLLNKCTGDLSSKHTYKTIQFLLENGADPYVTTNKVEMNYHNLSPLEALIYSYARSHSYFKGNAMKKYIRLFKKHQFNMDTLNLCCANAEVDLIKFLVKEGVPKRLDIGLVFSYSPWQWAFQDHLSYFKEFEMNFVNIDLGASFSDPDIEDLDLLLELGLSPNREFGRTRMPLLFFLTEKEDTPTKLLKKLIHVYNADLSITFKGESLIEFAKRLGKEEVVTFLENRPS
ncbi:MAG: hypothetical protein ACRBFS_22385 [Aureispira sp.]